MTEPYFNITNVTELPFDLHLDAFDNGTSWNEELERFVSISVFILFSFIFFAGLIGNGLVVTGESIIISRASRYNSFKVVLANPLMRSTTNILIINLAVADLLFVIFCKRIHSTSWMPMELMKNAYFRRSLHRNRLHSQRLALRRLYVSLCEWIINFYCFHRSLYFPLLSF